MRHQKHYWLKKMQTYSFHSLTNYYLIFKKSRVTVDTEKTEEKG